MALAFCLAESSDLPAWQPQAGPRSTTWIVKPPGSSPTSPDPHEITATLPVPSTTMHPLMGTADLGRLDLSVRPDRCLDVGRYPERHDRVWPRHGDG